MKTQVKVNRSFRIISPIHNKKQIEGIEDFLQAEGFEFIEDTFFPLARKCTNEIKALGSSLAHYFGLIYIQDRASMLPPIALNPCDDALILDMCASPGSKTSMLSYMAHNGMVIGNEPNPTRLANLKRNLETMQCFNAITCNYDGTQIPLDDASFDSILLDPPCSGWGTIDKNPKVKEIWTPDKAQNLVNLQKRLLCEAVRLLKMNGTLVYSTCTTNKEENEKQVEFAINELGLELDELALLPEFEMEKNTTKGVWRLETIENDTQGFFVARFKKIKEVDMANLKAMGKKPKYKNQNLQFSSVYAKEFDALKGDVCPFGKGAYFVPTLAQDLSKQNSAFFFQAMNVGKNSGMQMQISPRLRLFQDAKDKIVFSSKEDLQTIYALIQGQSIPFDSQNNNEKFVPLYWKDLYLGNLTRKSNRLLWTIK